MVEIILYESKENCCGCTACYAICPINAITMQSDSEGFLYPKINKDKCVQCGKCLRVCIFKQNQVLKGFIRKEEVHDE